MTALEYMERQLDKHMRDYERELARKAPDEMLGNIKNKIGYYEAAAKALRM